MVGADGLVYQLAPDGALARRPVWLWAGGQYQCVDLRTAGGWVRQYVHRLVAWAWLGAPPAGKNQVRHLNGDSLDNQLVNLAWGDEDDQALDRCRHGTAAKKLTPAKVRNIRRRLLSAKRYARQYRVSEATIYQIWSGATWGWLT